MLSVPLVAALPRTNVHHCWQQVCLRRIGNMHNPFFSSALLLPPPLVLVVSLHFVTAHGHQPCLWAPERSQSGGGTSKETPKPSKRGSHPSTAGISPKVSILKSHCVALWKTLLMGWISPRVPSSCLGPQCGFLSQGSDNAINKELPIQRTIKSR